MLDFSGLRQTRHPLREELDAEMTSESVRKSTSSMFNVLVIHSRHEPITPLAADEPPNPQNFLDDVRSGALAHSLHREASTPPPTMPKEVKQKSGIITGINAGHVRFPP